MPDQELKCRICSGKHDNGWCQTPEGIQSIEEARLAMDAWKEIAEQLFKIGEIVVRNPKSDHARQVILALKKSLANLEAGKVPYLGDGNIADVLAEEAEAKE